MKKNLEVFSFLQPLFYASLVVVLLLRIYSSVSLWLLPNESISSFVLFFKALTEDLWFLMLEFFVLFLAGILTIRISSRLMKVFSYFIVLLLLFIQIGFTEYFLTVHQLVDSTIYFFSYDELAQTIGLSERFTFSTVLGLLVVLSLFLLTVRFSKKKSFKPTSKHLIGFIVSSLILIGPLPFYSTSSDESAIEVGAESNLTMYFLNSSIHYSAADDRMEIVHANEFTKLDPAFTGGQQEDNMYPLFREVDNTSMLAERLNKTSNGKAPNIVFIIVEGLSSDYLGEKAGLTGYLMPFMDSLVKESMYYPNMLSTAQRTQNALPSTLCSVPNVDEGTVFQQMHYPNHWSLLGLVKPTYQTSFNCGVLLEYMNMRGFMNYHAVDALSNSWTPSVERQNKELDSHWGVPDGALFEQFLTQKRKKTNKSTFDVFLTISTHDPFKYPKKERYTQLAQQRLSKIKGTKYHKELLAVADKLGSYSYLDDELKELFGELKKRPEYKNTVFLITGDHGSELWNRTPLSKYHVPFVIYSPLLKKPSINHTIVSHLDVTPTIHRYLSSVYGVQLPTTAPYIGQELDPSTSSTFPKVNRGFIFTSAQLKNKDLFYNNIALVDDRLYRVGKGMSLTEIHDTKRLSFMKAQRDLYKLMSRYTIHQNKLIPPRAFTEFYKAVVWKEASKHEYQIPTGIEHKQLIDIGILKSSVLKKKRVKVMVEIDAGLNSMRYQDSLPDLVISCKKLKRMKRDDVLYRLVRPTLTKKGHSKDNSKLMYEVTFDTRQVPKLKGVQKCWIYLYYKYENWPMVYRAETVISTADN